MRIIVDSFGIKLAADTEAGGTHQKQKIHNIMSSMINKRNWAQGDRGNNTSRTPVEPLCFSVEPSPAPLSDMV